MCFNWKVPAGLAVVGAGIVLFAPNLAASALPILLLAICPLFMLFMGRTMMGSQGQQTGAAGQYTCPMHPDVQSEQMGRCRKCGMGLVQTVPEAGRPVDQPASGERGREVQLAALKAQLDGIQAQQETIAREIVRLESAESPAVRAAEAVAQAAEERARGQQD